MTSLSTRIGPSTFAPGDGSRTITILDSQPREEGAESCDEGSASGRSQGVLRLQGGPRSRPRVAWTEDVVDNEGMGKKKSKICCIYHKPKKFDESSDEDSSDDSDSSSGHGRGHHHHRHHCHPHDGDGVAGGDGANAVFREGGSGVVIQEFADDDVEPNAYERYPGKSKKGKGRADPN